ncbi:fimbria/pilus periplasmic chaperone [Pseudomonas sp. McL0111]|uniref:fimbria/pilus periplasmic chaperone n=1 Tax=Pseudomonas sp. McL0111 TaxID=3457357 RepID=UPI00403E6555
MNILFRLRAASRISAIVVVGLMTTTVAETSQAGVVISGTRVIYPAEQKDVSVWFQSKNQTPVLVQVWLDDGDENIAPEKASVPFVATPPIFRLEPGKQQVVRLIYTGEPLPTDKESLFWLNMLEVPPKAQGDEASSQLQLAFRTRLKVFFRPRNLPYDPTQAAEKLRWELVAEQQGFALRVTNPTPYNISFDSVELVAGGQRHAKPTGQTAAQNMVAPGASNLFSLPGLKSSSASGALVEFKTINDLGSVTAYSAKISP